MRARNVKPGFFKNSKLGKLSAHHRILFVGLWCMADALGRLKDDPDFIKAEVLPYDEVDVNQMLTDLESSPEKFIVRYSVNNQSVIQINKFEKHQNPHLKERQKGSDFPPLPEQARENPEPVSEIPELVGMNPDSLNLNPETTTPTHGVPPDGSGGCFFKIHLRGDDLTEKEWIFRCMLEGRRSKKLSLQGCDSLEATLTLYPSYREVFKRWVLLPMPRRIAAFVYTNLHGKPENQFSYALTVAETGKGAEYDALLKAAEQQVADGDYTVRID